MSIVTLDLPDDLLNKVADAAREQSMTREGFLVAEIAASLQGREVRKRFHERAQRGAGREEEALELLRRTRGEE